MLKIRLLFFAVLRDLAGVSEQTVELAEGSRPADVWQLLRDSYPELRDYIRPPMAAVNETYVNADYALADGDELAFIPPVAGG